MSSRRRQLRPPGRLSLKGRWTSYERQVCLDYGRRRAKGEGPGARPTAWEARLPVWMLRNVVKAMRRPDLGSRYPEELILEGHLEPGWAWHQGPIRIGVRFPEMKPGHGRRLVRGPGPESSIDAALEYRSRNRNKNGPKGRIREKR